jgi:signal transduction histidine kinase
MGKKNVSMAVTDTGPGIPEEELPGLFSEFKRLKGTANSEGTGLGLFIVKTIVEGHGGTVAVQSKNGGGATFTILLPAYAESGAMRPNSAGNESEMGTWVGRCA